MKNRSRSLEQYFYKKVSTPVGELILTSTNTHLASIHWSGHSQHLKLSSTHHPTHPLLNRAHKQLQEYFLGKRTRFNLPLDYVRGTDFQRKVWGSLQEIEYGKTRNYQQLAQRVGSPRAFRAVGTANSKNPFPIVIPCHRVISKSGKLSGFVGGVRAKAHLLALENR